MPPEGGRAAHREHEEHRQEGEDYHHVLLEKLETLAADTVWEAANEIPPEWFGGNLGEMETLVEKLLARRSRIRELIEGFGKSERRPFPRWEGMGQKLEEVCKERKWATSITERVQ